MQSLSEQQRWEEEGGKGGGGGRPWYLFVGGKGRERKKAVQI